MTTRQPFYEYIRAQLRELDLVSAMLSQVRGKYSAACGRRAAARELCNKSDENRRRVMARYSAYYRAEARAHALSCAVDILDRRRAILSDEITRAVMVNALRGTLRGAFGKTSISGAEIARRYHDLSDAVSLTRWLRNIDLARSAELRTAFKDLREPPEVSDDYVDHILLPGLLGYSKSQHGWPLRE